MSSRTTKCEEEPCFPSDGWHLRASLGISQRRLTCGRIMWEIFTLCKCQPYEEMEDQEIIQDAIKGYGY